MYLWNSARSLEWDEEGGQAIRQQLRLSLTYLVRNASILYDESL